MIEDGEQSEFIKVGHFGRAHGIEGEVRFFLVEFDQELFEQAVEEAPIAVETFDSFETYTVRGIRWANDFGILALERIDDRDRAEELTNLDVFLREDDLPELQDEEYYRAELTGCDVFVLGEGSEGGRKWIGHVAGFFETGSNDVMIVDLSERDILNVPMLDHAIASLDPEQEEVELEPLEAWAPRGTKVD